MLRLVVLISGAGSNLLALLDACGAADFPAQIVAVGADRDAEGLEHARARGVPAFTVPWEDFSSRKAWGEALLAHVEEWEPDLVILSGLMRLLPPEAVDALSPRLLNTHPAYLPDFPGAHAVRDTLAAGVSETGASIIIVDNGVDTGPVIAQVRVPVLVGDSEESLHERIKIIERDLLVATILDIANGTINLEDLV